MLMFSERAGEPIENIFFPSISQIYWSSYSCNKGLIRIATYIFFEFWALCCLSELILVLIGNNELILIKTGRKFLSKLNILF